MIRFLVSVSLLKSISCSIKYSLVLTLQFVILTSSAQYTKLFNFTGGTEARDPNGVLVTDGTFLYGITYSGGTSDMGTVYKIKQDGTGYVKLHDFIGTNGKNPEGSLYFDGTFLYGMTYYGGTNDLGTIYKIKPDGTNFLKLLDFNGTNGNGPYGNFVSDGTYLYGMTWQGGANNLGRIFRIKPDGTGYQNLLDFAGAANGSYPSSMLYYDGSFLYGTTSAGGANGVGTIFKINTNGTGYDNLYDFAGGTDGREPYGALVGDGTYLYGMTYFGGTSDLGTVFKIKDDGTNYNKLVNFTGSTTGSHPYTSLVFLGSSLYGTTIHGGSSNLGTLFTIKPDGTGFARLLSFTGSSNGSTPYATLFTVGPYLYGTTSLGGTTGNGTLFKYQTNETFTKLLDFTGPFNGLVPFGSLYTDGTFLYGMTEEGGANDMGTVFKMKQDGTGYTKLLDFSGSLNGRSPKGSFISDGTFLYGMTSLGGSSNAGTIFKIMPDGTGYVKLHDFGLLANGVYPESDLYYDGTWLYGMTPFGGANNRGTFFKIKPDGTGYAKLSDFGAPFDGNQPVSSLYFDGTFFYGTTNRGGSANLGTIFKIMPDGSNLTKLLNFGVGTNGRYPEGSFTSDGTYLYGTTEEGGANNYGSLFKIKPDGTGYTTILSFDNNIYGSSPQGTPLLVGEFLYALTFVGGPNYEGAIFKIKKDGTNFSTVHEFSSVLTGSAPVGCSLIRDGSYFFGMTTSGGLNEGTVFRFRDIAENTTLLTFTGTANGSQPTYTKLVCDGTSLYGMTSRGGTNDAGVVFKINSDGSSFTKLHDFGPAPDGDRPFGSLYYDGTFLYGMTDGGVNNNGTIFKIQPNGTGYQKIFDFNGATTGAEPWGSLISDGTYLYGLTAQGGTGNSGAIFKILPDGTGFLKLHDFASGAGFPVGDLLLIGTTLYGMTFDGGADGEGVVFKIGTNGTGFNNIHEFGFPDGGAPYTGALVYDGTFLYGMTEIGGTPDDGLIFKIKPDGTGYTSIHDFQLPTSGIPLGGLVLVGSKLYGLTTEGGPDNLGTLFEISTNGTGYQTLMNFDGISNGYEPLGTLCHCGDGLYGMTTSGGANDEGTIFKYSFTPPSSTLTITQQPLNPNNRCEGQNFTFSTDATGTTNITFQWQKFNTTTSLFENISDGAVYSGTNTKNLLITNVQLAQDGDYRCMIQGDLASTVYCNTGTLTVNAVPTAPTVTDGSRCDAGAVTVSASGTIDGNYIWYGSNGASEPIPGENNAIYVTPVLAATTTYYVSIVNSFCESTLVLVNATITTTPISPTVTNGSRCGPGTITLSASGGTNGQYRWYTVPTGGSAIVGEVNSSYTTPSISSTTTYFVSILNGTCESSRISVTAAITSCNAPPSIATTTVSVPLQGNITINLLPLLSDPNDDIDLSTLSVAVQPSSGALASITGTQLTIDYTGINFSGTDFLTLSVCDFNSACVQQQFSIEVIGSIIVYNAISAGRDGKNDIFLLQYIDILEETKNNRVTIFNRWGDVVWEGTNYNNTTIAFDGTNNNGKELPSGTYFYRIDFSGQESMTGYLSLKR